MQRRSTIKRSQKKSVTFIMDHHLYQSFDITGLTLEDEEEEKRWRTRVTTDKTTLCYQWFDYQICLTSVASVCGGRLHCFQIHLSECALVQVNAEAQNIRVLSFKSSCFLSPQIVICAFIPNSFLLLIKPPSVVLLQLICYQTVFNIGC